MENIFPNEKLRAYFEKVYGRELTENEVAEYKDRVVNLFSVLVEIDQRNKQKVNETKAN